MTVRMTELKIFFWRLVLLQLMRKAVFFDSQLVTYESVQDSFLFLSLWSRRCRSVAVASHCTTLTLSPPLLLRRTCMYTHTQMYAHALTLTHTHTHTASGLVGPSFHLIYLWPFHFPLRRGTMGGWFESSGFSWLLSFQNKRLFN